MSFAIVTLFQQASPQLTNMFHCVGYNSNLTVFTGFTPY